jgi:hypothetical protein
VSSVVSRALHGDQSEDQRYDTDAQNTALMLHFVVSDHLDCLTVNQRVVGSSPTAGVRKIEP